MAGIIKTENTDDTATRLNPKTPLERALEKVAAGQFTALTPEEQAALTASVNGEQPGQGAPTAVGSVPQPQASTSGYTSGYPSASPGMSAVDLYNQSRVVLQQQNIRTSLWQAGSDGPEPEVIRERKVERRPPFGAQNPSIGTPTRRAVPYQTTTRAPLSVYEGEYGEKVNDPVFRDWLLRRGVVLAGMDPEDPDFLSKGLSLWRTAGAMVAANPTLRGSVTPEEWLDGQYRLRGGDSAYETLLKTLKPNPITRNVSTQTYTVTAAQAQGVIDDLSQSLLGRMASDAELKRARAVMQKLLTPTVTTTVQDATDPNNVQTTSHTKAGVGPGEAQAILRMRMQRGSEGMAFNVGSMFENALRRMG